MRNALPPRPDVGHTAPTRPRRGRTVAIVIGVIALCAAAGVGGWTLGAPDRDRGTASTPPPTDGPSTGTAPAETDQGPFRFFETDADGPLGWDPCRQIHYEVNLSGAPEDAMASVDDAVERIEAATGFDLVFDGQTHRGPIATSKADFLDDLFGPEPVLISWLAPERFEYFAPPRRAAAVGRPRRGRGPDFDWYTSGMIVVNAGAHANAGWGHRWALGPVLLHEWGHVLGLAHVKDGDQLMWSDEVPGAEPRPDPYLTDYGDGDLAGLARLAEVPCAA
jgi:hypothetical protein